MRVAFYTIFVSPHMLPLARAVAQRVGQGNFLYVGEDTDWYGTRIETGVRILRETDEEAREWIENADVLYTGGLRPIDLLERRAKRGLKSLYCSERWFKPVRLFDLRLLDCLIGVTVPGWLRMVVPWYRKMARRFVRLANENACVKFLPIGPWSRRDFLRMGVRADRMVDWGYFVAPSAGEGTVGRRRRTMDGDVLRLLWAGRMLDWKRTETVIRAANEFKVEGLKFKVTLVGDGPEKGNLIKLARRLFPDAVAIEQSDNPKSNNQTILFLSSQPMERIRELMREHDVLVLTSDAGEGWGAVVNEALEEGMDVLGTFEAGASAAMLPEERLYHAGDAKALATLIRKEMCGALPPCSIGEWTAEKAAERMLGL